MPISYRDAGVDIDAGAELVRRIRPLAKATRTPLVVSDVGGFASLCRLPEGMKEPLLVSGTDGVGTKLKVAFATGRHDTVGIDLVAMCVNDIITVGADPLFFLDYFATGKLTVDQGEAVVRGVAEGCRRAGCALVGGETAEMPGMYASGEYDLAGFAVGVVEKSRVLGPERVQVGDRLVGLASSGLHSNGYSLARRVVEHMGLGWNDTWPDTDLAVGDSLLTPTRMYAKVQKTVREAVGLNLRAMCHVTGGGFPENLPRALPEGAGAVIQTSAWTPSPIFEAIQRGGPVEEAEMWRTFNMGVGFVFVVAGDVVDDVVKIATEAGETAFLMGEVVSDPEKKVTLK